MAGAPVYVVDASVVVKWFVFEPGRDKALKVRGDYLNGSIDLIAPTLMSYEVANALRFHPGATAAEVKDSLTELREMQIAAQNLTDTTIGLAVEMAYSDGITFYDAVYLALARSLGTKTLTADEKLSKGVKKAETLLLHVRNYG